MEALYFDGLTARSRPVELTVRDGRLLGSGTDGEVLDWRLAELSVTKLGGGRCRVAGPGDGRLTVDAAAWREIAGTASARRNEWKLVAGLTVAGAAFAGLVFFGIPAVAGPLSRITPPAFEAQMGANMEKQLTLVLRPCDDRPRATAQLDALGDVLAKQADTPFEIRVRAVRAPMVNAFALPGGLVLVTSDLIEEAQSPDELAGVLAHEIAHVEKRHVMHSVWRSMGVGLLLDAVLGGGTGAGQQAVLLVGGLTEQRFSRELEAEADARALEILRGTDISSAGLAAFFERLAGKRSTGSADEVAEWFATHPDSVRRADRARANAHAGRPALSAEGWRELKQICRRA